ncbi:hypothetical protein EJB05_22365 [Eragrostis curvula]|uniref:Uncharacterized protein n=1 Tax=Eragrostis curvula TaxID=38414 RepID=A0A5J9V619_9POAL|nr:hypothetical protein EJB05_22365 [Eragrostis curvula]
MSSAPICAAATIGTSGMGNKLFDFVALLHIDVHMILAIWSASNSLFPTTDSTRTAWMPIMRPSQKNVELI